LLIQSPHTEQEIVLEDNFFETLDESEGETYDVRDIFIDVLTLSL
jgi:hypothetical protein